MGQSMDIYGRVANATTATCSPRGMFGERACNAYSVGCAPPRLRGTCGLRLFALLPGEIVPMNKHPQLGAGLASGRRLLAQIDTTKSLGDLSCPTDVFQSAFDGPVRWRTSTGDEPKAYNVRVGALRQRNELVPRRQIFVRSQQPWVNDFNSIPKFEGMPH